MSRPAYRDFSPGVRVKLSGKFLKSTSQTTGGEGASCWTVRSCDCSLCARGTHVATDQESAYFRPEDLEGPGRPSPALAPHRERSSRNRRPARLPQLSLNPLLLLGALAYRAPASIPV
jgi:hypothetical protein